MGIELSASRYLAPYYGTSTTVWTVVIGILLLSISMGNALGGRVADSPRRFKFFYFCLLFAALWIGLIPWLGHYAVMLIAMLLTAWNPAYLMEWGSIMTCLLLFAPPAVMLGMTTPFVLRTMQKERETNGRMIGGLHAFSTLGSITGTVLPTFVTIPLMGTHKTFTAIALAVSALFTLHAFLRNRKRAIGIVLCFVLLVSLFIPVRQSFAFWKTGIEEKESQYNYIQLSTKGPLKMLGTNVGYALHTVAWQDRSATGFYYDYMAAAPFFLADQDRPLDVLVLGSGAGTSLMQYQKLYPDFNVTGVEIDPQIAACSRELFPHLNPDRSIVIADARQYVQNQVWQGEQAAYDIALVDVYQDISMPWYLCTHEFFSLLKCLLSPDGVVVLNINLRSEEEDGLYQGLKDALKSVFQSLLIVDLPGGNAILYASDNQQLQEIFLKRTEGNLPSELEATLEGIRKNAYVASGFGSPPTDDFNKVEFYGQQSINQLLHKAIQTRQEAATQSELEILKDILQ